MKVTARHVAEAYVLAELMPGAPDLEPEHLTALAEVFNREGVNPDELRAAVLDFTGGRVRDSRGDVLQFWPNPPAVIERVRKNREAAFKAAEQERLDERLRESQRRLAIAAAGDAADKYDLPLGYPPRQGPPIDPTPLRDDSRRGPVLLPDGTPDPYWPEIPGRAPAWRRKLLYDAGFSSWQSASALTQDAARKAPSALADALNDTTRGGGPTRLL